MKSGGSGKAQITGYETKLYSTPIPAKWDFVTVEENLAPGIAAEFLILESTIARAVYDNITPPPEEILDFSIITKMCLQYARKVRKEYQFPVELIAAIAQRPLITKLEHRCFRELRKAVGGKEEVFGPWDLQRWREEVVEKVVTENMTPEVKSDGTLVVPIAPGSKIPPGADYFGILDKCKIPVEILMRIGKNMTERVGFPQQRPPTSCYRNTQLFIVIGGRHTMVSSKQKSLLEYCQNNGLDWIHYSEMRLHRG